MSINGEQEKELFEKVNEIHTGIAILGVQMKHLQTCVNTFKDTRKATCPMGTALDRIGNKADDSIEDIKVDREKDEKRDEYIGEVKTSVRSWKLTLITLGTVCGVVGGILGVLKSIGAL